MERLILVSNRLPVTVNKNDNGDFIYQQSSGGLATGLAAVYKKYDGFWLGWPGINDEEISESEKEKLSAEMSKNKNYPIFLSEEDINNYYYGFCNKTIWPLFHYYTQFARYPDKYWQAYKKVNSIFFESLKNKLKPGDNLWIHDYHLMLLPGMVHREFPNINIGFFLHIPFPSFEIFRVLPWKEQLLKGLLGADIIGFHTYGYVRHFLSSVLRILGYNNKFNKIMLEDRTVKAELFPMGIDYEKFNQAQHRNDVQKEIKNLKKKTDEARIILSVDRLDYTKGIPERLRAFDYFLKNNTKYHGKVMMIVIAVPSRTKIEKYEDLKIEVNELVGDINGKYGTLDWEPVRFLFRAIPFERLLALYNYSDVCLITPLRDGMNLVSKEYVAASHDKGVLILSDMAGAAYELSEAISITPTRKEEIAASIKKALLMSADEQKERLQTMKERIKNYDVNKWANSFVNNLINYGKEKEDIKHKNISQKEINDILKDYNNSSKRLLIFDYDIFTKKQKTQLRDWIIKLSDDFKNTLVIISEETRENMHKKFKNTGCYLIAEYGKYFYTGTGWKVSYMENALWLEDIEPIVKRHMENTPGAYIKKGSNYIRWNCRKSEPELARMRKKELQDTLTYFSQDFDVNIVEGKDYLEIKSSSIEVNNILHDITNNSSFDFHLFSGSLNRYPKIVNPLPENTHILEHNSNTLQHSCLLKNSRQLIQIFNSDIIHQQK